MFYFENLQGKKILKSDLIQKAQAFFTTRGICIFDKSDTVPSISHSKQIEANRRIIEKYLGVEENNLVFPVQTHSTNVNDLKNEQYNYPDTDALILSQKNKAIFLNFADCTPIILYDKKQNIGAVSHAGWRGTAGKIAVKTVLKMVSEYNSTPKNIVALIGPAIGFCCYDVGEDVMLKLSKTVEKFDNLYEIREGKIFVDLKNINKRQLEQEGLEQIDVCPYCTVHNNDLFFSYRNENKTTLRHSAILYLKQ